MIRLADPAVLAAGPSVPAFLAPTTALVAAAAVIGYLSVRSRVVPIVGFLVAGVLIGPAQLGLVERADAVEVAAEVGVILLLFTIGIEFSLGRLAGLWRYIVVGGGLQVTLTTLLALAVVRTLGASWQEGVFTGFVVSLSSTAIVLKLLADRGEQRTPRGQLAVAVLVFQDLAVVAMVLVVPQLGGGDGTGASGLASALGTALVVVAVTVVVARRVMPPLLERVARTCSTEVFLLTVVAVCFGTAYLTALAGVSVSLGAFLAGLVVSESRHGTHALSEVLPLQILFAAAFFVSVGMLLDLGFLLADPGPVVVGLLAVLVGKAAATTAGLLVLRTPWRTAAGTGLLLAQVGEFSFVLLTVGLAAGLTPAGLGEDGAQAAVAGTVVLMAATPLLASLAARVDRRATPAPPAAGTVVGDGSDDEGGHVLLLGWGEGAAEVARTLRARGHRVVVTTLSPDLAAEAEELGAAVVRGDASRRVVLEGANAEGALAVVVAEHDAEEALRVAAAARRSTSAPIVVRTPDRADVGQLVAAGADHVVDSPRHSHASLVSATLGALGESPAGPGGGRTVVDVTKVVDYRVPPDSGCVHGDASHPVLPSSPGCEDCLREGTTDWVHLRTCLTCGHVGCCDSSPGRHATGHHASTGHPLVASAEPGETWAYCYLDAVTVPAAAPSSDQGRSR
ncbi:MAG: cation:proton antiporter [Actinomycetes bacterium]